jgi:tellurite resistance protein
VAVESAVQRAAAAVFERIPAGDERGLLVELAAAVAMADGRIDDPERRALAVLLDDALGMQLGEAIVHRLVDAALEEVGRFGIEQRTREIGEALKRHDAAEAGVRFGYTVAHASGGVEAGERAVIALVARAAGVSNERLTAIERESQP